MSAIVPSAPHLRGRCSQTAVKLSPLQLDLVRSPNTPSVQAHTCAPHTATRCGARSRASEVAVSEWGTPQPDVR